MNFTKVPIRAGAGGDGGVVTAGARGRSPFGHVAHLAWRLGVWIALAVLVIVLCVLSDSFRTTANLQNILAQNAIIGVVACGMLVMMVSGGFDLSVGATGAAAGAAAAHFSTGSLGLAGAIIAALAIGLAVGSINGLLIAKGGINPFITTFAMASVVSGILFVVTSAQSQSGSSGWLGELAFSKTFELPTVFIVFLGFALLTHLILSRTKLGHWIYSTGGNAEASYLSGVPIGATRISAFVFGGLAAGAAALLLFGQTNIGQPTAAADWPLNAIAICIIGGTSLEGGVGRVSDVVAATLLLGVVANGLNQLAVSPYWQPTVTGLIILGAVAFDGISRRGRLRM